VLALGGFYSMNAWEIVFWLAAALVAARLLRGGGPRLWILLGGLLGLGLLNKYSTALLAAGLVAGLLLSPHRRRLGAKQAWIGAGLAVALVLPHLAWQARHDWPTLEFIDNARTLKMARLSPGQFWKDAVLMLHPLAAPLVLIGLVAPFAGRRLRPFRPLAVTVLVAALVLFVTDGKPYYLVAAWPLAVATGATALEAWLSRFGRVARRVGGGAYAALLLVTGLALAPLAIPLLPVDRLLAYQQRLGIAPASGENHETGALPQHFADRFGWRRLAGTVFGVVAGLPAEERASCLLVAGNYGEAGALRYYGAGRWMPPVASGHNSFFLWGLPPGAPWRVVVAVGFGADDLRAVFEQVEVAAVHRDDLAMPYESDLPVYVCRGWRVAPAAAWARIKRYI